MKKFLFFLIFSSFLFSKESLIIFGGGVFDVLKEKHRAEEFFFEYRLKKNFLKISPFIGSKITTKRSLYVYFGFSGDIFLKDIFITPSLAMGYYDKGNGKDLGYPLEFRSCIYLGYRFQDKRRVGVGFYHISNASLGSKNPGEESLVVFLAVPF